MTNKRIYYDIKCASINGMRVSSLDKKKFQMSINFSLEQSFPYYWPVETIHHVHHTNREATD